MWDHAVSAGLPGPTGVETSDDSHRQLLLLPVGLSQAFVDRFAARVGPAELVCWPEHAIVVFGEWNRDAFSVHFAAGEQDDPALMGRTGFENDRSSDVGERTEGVSSTYLTPTAAAKW
jgi:hypothetical protein